MTGQRRPHLFSFKQIKNVVVEIVVIGAILSTLILPFYLLRWMDDQSWTSIIGHQEQESPQK